MVVAIDQSGNYLFVAMLRLTNSRLRLFWFVASLWLRTQSCNYLFVAILRLTNSWLRLFWFVAIFCGFELRVATICSISIFCRNRTHGCDYFGSLRYLAIDQLTVATIWFVASFVDANSELQLFVRCDIVIDELTVATILFVAIMFQHQADGCDYWFGRDNSIRCDDFSISS